MKGEESRAAKAELSPVMKRKIEPVCDAVDRWSVLWGSVEGRYSQMSMDEVRAFNAQLNVLACNTMNDLVYIRHYSGGKTSSS